MRFKYTNLVFSGGGVLSIAYLGALEYFYQTGLIYPIVNLAGTSAGAITACLTSFNLPFDELKTMLNSLDYRKVPGKDNSPQAPRYFPKVVKDQLSKVFDNVDCVYRLIKNYGWYSSQYFYDWIKLQIASQFDSEKKAPPYTFSDFREASLHKDKRPFKDLFIIGTDITKSTSTVFSYKTTPNMEVAEAVRISMSVPLLFESIKTSCDINENDPQILFVDGGILYNYPITLFDQDYPLEATIGICFKGIPKANSINNIVDFISCSLSCSGSIQNELFESKPANIARSICIQTSDVSSFNFDISPNDDTHNFLYEQGYRAAETYFSLLR